MRNKIQEYMKKAEEYYKLGKYEEAIEICNKIISLDNRCVAAYNNRANLYEILKKYEKAIEGYDEGIEIDNQPMLYYNRALLYGRLGMYNEAIEGYTDTINLEGNNVNAYNNRGNIYRKLEAYENAENDFNKAIELSNKKDGILYLNRGKLYCDLGKYEEALEDFNKALKLEVEKDMCIDAYNGKGVAYYFEGNYNEAIKNYDEVMKIDSKNVATYSGKGSAYYQLGEYNKAIEQYNEAIKLDDRNIDAYNNRGWTYRALKEEGKAEKDFNKAIKLREKMENNKIFKEYLYSKLNEKKYIDYKADLLELFDKVIDIKSILKYEEKIRLGHYTKIKNLKNLLKYNAEAKMRLNNIDYMNDPDEGKAFLKILENNGCKNIDKSMNMKEEYYNNIREEIRGEGNIFLMSLSKNIDNSLPMWNSYAGDGKGCCLVFDSEFFKEEIEMSEKNKSGSEVTLEVKRVKLDGLYNVVYVKKNIERERVEYSIKYGSKDDEKRIKKNIDGICEIINKINSMKKESNEKSKVSEMIMEILNQIRFLFKDDTYEYEEEVRLIKFIDIEDKKNKNIEDKQREAIIKITGDLEDNIVLHLYVEFNKNIEADEVVIGPKVENEKEIANYIRYTGKANIITKTRIRYR